MKVLIVIVRLFDQDIEARYLFKLKHKVFTTNHTNLGATLEDSVNATGIFGIIHLLLCTLSFLLIISNKKGQNFTIFLPILYIVQVVIYVYLSTLF